MFDGRHARGLAQLHVVRLGSQPFRDRAELIRGLRQRGQRFRKRSRIGSHSTIKARQTQIETRRPLRRGRLPRAIKNRVAETNHRFGSYDDVLDRPETLEALRRAVR